MRSTAPALSCRRWCCCCLRRTAAALARTRAPTRKLLPSDDAYLCRLCGARQHIRCGRHRKPGAPNVQAAIRTRAASCNRCSPSIRFSGIVAPWRPPVTSIDFTHRVGLTRMRPASLQSWRLADVDRIAGERVPAEPAAPKLCIRQAGKVLVHRRRRVVVGAGLEPGCGEHVQVRQQRAARFFRPVTGRCSILIIGRLRLLGGVAGLAGLGGGGAARGGRASPGGVGRDLARRPRNLEPAIERPGGSRQRGLPRTRNRRSSRSGLNY